MFSACVGICAAWGRRDAQRVERPGALDGLRQLRQLLVLVAVLGTCCGMASAVTSLVPAQFTGVHESHTALYLSRFVVWHYRERMRSNARIRARAGT
jgi:hypothetical protein